LDSRWIKVLEKKKAIIGAEKGVVLFVEREGGGGLSPRPGKKSPYQSEFMTAAKDV